MSARLTAEEVAKMFVRCVRADYTEKAADKELSRLGDFLLDLAFSAAEAHEEDCDRQSGQDADYLDEVARFLGDAVAPLGESSQLR